MGSLSWVAGTGNHIPKIRLLAAVMVLSLFASGCSVRKFAIGKLGDALAQSGTTFS